VLGRRPIAQSRGVEQQPLRDIGRSESCAGKNEGATGFVDVTTATGTENTFDPTTANPPVFAASWGMGSMTSTSTAARVPLPEAGVGRGH
jgi:hypothetical protein